MPQITGTFATQSASKYIQQLCKHFGHKVKVDYSETEGLAELPTGPTRMTATADALHIVMDIADESLIERGKSIIDSHLKTFAHREGFEEMDWS